MKSNEVLREAAEVVGVKALASELKLSAALIYKWCQEADPNDPDLSGARNPLDRLKEIIDVTGHIGVVTWLCQVAGGFFVHNAATSSKDIDADLLQSTQHLVNGFSKLLNEVSRSVADDGAIGHQEAMRIRAGWEKLKTTAETFVHACEKGLYRVERGK
ncbi:MAG TPA: hypothetical protein VNT79_16365 [Phycisphaerae bacterium]|nr:hypothetical protein [Phycisphaerae bacterium]